MNRCSFARAMVVMLLAATSLLSAQTSTWVFVDTDGRLHYHSDANGNRIMDFSFAGYQGGGVALPTVPVAQTVSPISGDNTANIQAAIDAVSQLAPDGNGFRGAVLLGPGTYDVSGTINIATSGVVLRGSGSGTGGTLLNMTGSPHLVFSLRGTGSWQTSGGSVAMSDAYVPSGAMSFNVSDASSFSVGDTILVRRPVTAAWVHFMGMDTLVRNGLPQTWISVGTLINTDRVITAINGNQITLDAPLTDSFDSTLLNPPGGSVIKYTFPTRISQVGIEHLSVVAPAVNVDISQPQFTGLALSAIMNAWADDLSFQDTQNTVTVSSTSKQVTLDNIQVSHTVTHTGDRMADFGVNGTQIFINKGFSNGTGEWPFVTQGQATGPVALLNFSSTQQAGIGPHQRWFTGLVADNCTLPNAPANVDGGATGINFSDRGNHGSGQGWAIGWGVAWNDTTPFFVVQEPPGADNWCIGCVGQELSGTEPGSGTPVPNGIYESLGTPVTPSSLYLAQLKDRLGNAAIANIGYGDFAFGATPSSRTVMASAGASYSVSVTPSGTFSDSVVLSVSGLPSGSSASFSPSSLASGNSTLNVSTSASTPVGSYTLVITGTSGNLSHSVTVTLNVTNFSITASPNSQTVVQGNSTSYTASVSPINGFTGTVSLSASGLPSGATGTFNPASINGSGSAAFGVSTTSSTPPGTYTVTITGTIGGLSHSTTVSLVVNPIPLPAGWSDTDIGAPGLAGSASFSGGTFTVNGSGSDIWSTSDNFNYASESLAGDVTITARVASQQNTSAWAKSGVMIRENTAANSAYVFVFITPGNGVNMQYRPSTGAAAVQLAQQAGHAAPYWVRLVRSGSTFTGFSSADGVTWSQAGTISVTMASNAREGLAVTAHNNTVLNTTTFDNVSVTTPVCVTAMTGGTWQNTALAAAETGTFTAQFDATPSASPINSVVALSQGVQTTYTGFATLARFNPSGDIDARNGGAYSAASVIPYTGGKTYHFRMVINVPAHTYSVFVTPPGGSELTVGSNFAFRTEQNTVTSLDHWGVFADTGSDTVCSFTAQ